MLTSRDRLLFFGSCQAESHRVVAALQRPLPMKRAANRYKSRLDREQTMQDTVKCGATFNP